MARTAALLLLTSMGLLVVITLVYVTVDNNIVSFSADSPEASPTPEIIQATLIPPNPSPTPWPTSSPIPRPSGSGFGGFSVDRNREGIKVPGDGPLFSGQAGKCRIAKMNAQDIYDEERRQRGLENIERYC